MTKRNVTLIVMVVLVAFVLSALLVAQNDTSRYVYASPSGNIPLIPSPPADATPTLPYTRPLPTPSAHKKYHHVNLGGKPAITQSLKNVTGVNQPNFAETDAKQFVLSHLGMFHLGETSSTTVDSVTFMTIGDFWKWAEAGHASVAHGEELGDELICRVLVRGNFVSNAIGAYILFDAHTGNWFESGTYHIAH